MNKRSIHAVVAAFCVALGTPRVVGAQDLGFSVYGGPLVPIATFGEYFTPGVTTGLVVGYPLLERVNLVLDVGFDLINMHQHFPTPNIHLWRYLVGAEADVLGDQGSDRILLKANVAAGGTTFRSSEFWVETRPTIDGEHIRRTSLTGSGGVRAGLRTGSGLVWWLGARLNWSPLDDVDSDLLHQAVRSELDPTSSATSFALTLGFNLNR